MTLPIGVVGGGFGKGIATAASRAGHDVILWSRTKKDSSDARIHPTNELASLADAGVIFVAVPSTHVVEIVPTLGTHLDGRHLLVHVSRGLLGDELSTLTQFMRAETPCRRVGALGGPLIASALREGTPSGAIVGSAFPEVVEAVRWAIGGPTLRIYETDDVIGVESASALTGLFAIATGFVQGVGIGPAALAVLVTRGMAESARVGMALGAREKTFAGLAGFGDVLAAVAGDGRPEVELGKALARGLSVDEALREARTHIEAVGLTRRVARFCAERRIDAPLASTLADVLDGKIPHTEALQKLMLRRSNKE